MLEQQSSALMSTETYFLCTISVFMFKVPVNISVFANEPLIFVYLYSRKIVYLNFNNIHSITTSLDMLYFALIPCKKGTIYEGTKLKMKMLQVYVTSPSKSNRMGAD